MMQLDSSMWYDVQSKPLDQYTLPTAKHQACDPAALCAVFERIGRSYREVNEPAGIPYVPNERRAAPLSHRSRGPELCALRPYLVRPRVCALWTKKCMVRIRSIPAVRNEDRRMRLQLGGAVVHHGSATVTWLGGKVRGAATPVILRSLQTRTRRVSYVLRGTVLDARDFQTNFSLLAALTPTRNSAR
jgi:hypothetical protein